MSMVGRRVRTRLRDALRYSSAMREAAGWLSYARAISSTAGLSRIQRLARALELAESSLLESAVLRSLKKMSGSRKPDDWRDAVCSLPRYRDLIRKDPALSRSIILKGPGAGGEKGVLLMTFEYNWARLLAGLGEDEFRWLDEHFDLVFSTSWSPTDYAVLGWAVSKLKGTVLVQSCNYEEIARIERFHPRVRCLRTLPCDWINPELYSPKPFSERTADIVMVANWGEFKRHWDLFSALSRMRKDLQIVLIGQREPGRSKETIIEEARAFGAKQTIQIYESLPIAEVAAHQCNAKVSVIMTRREGCCVAAVESLFAGCALAMRSDAHVGPLAYINEHTGKKLRPNRIAEDLTALLDCARDLRPHEWASRNLTCQLSHQQLNSLLRDEALQAGRPWTKDIAMPQWRPHPTFVMREEQDELKPTYDALNEKFPLVFSPNLRTESWR